MSAQRTELERRSLELREERARAIAALEEAEERATALERLGHEAERRAIVAERERLALIRSPLYLDKRHALFFTFFPFGARIVCVCVIYSRETVCGSGY